MGRAVLNISGVIESPAIISIESGYLSSLVIVSIGSRYLLDLSDISQAKFFAIELSRSVVLALFKQKLTLIYIQQ